MVVQPNMFQLKTVTVHNVKFAQKQMYSPFTVTNTMWTTLKTLWD